MTVRARYRFDAQDGSKRAVRSFRKNILSADRAVDGLKKRLVGMAGAAGLGLVAREVVKTGVSFGREMANVQSITGASKRELDALTNSAREWGRITAFSAREASQAQYALASAGLDVKQVIGSLGPVLKFAGAAQAELGQAAEITAGAMNAFKLKAKDTERIVNVFAAGIKASPLNAERLGDALAYAGPIAGTFNMSLEDTVGILGAFHSVNIKGAMAGTRFASTMLAMQKAMTSSKGRISELLKAWKPMETGLIGGLELLESAGYSAEEALAELGAKGGPGLAALLTKGTTAIKAMRDAVTDTDQATEAYKTQMDTTWGDFKTLMSALTDKAIGGWGKIEDGVRGSLQRMTEEINSWGQSIQDEAIQSMKDLGQEIEHIQQLTAIRDLVDTTAELNSESGSLFDAFEALGKTTERYDTSVKRLGAVMSDGTFAAKGLHSSFNDLAVSEGYWVGMVAKDAIQMMEQQNRAMDAADERARQLAESFDALGVDFTSLLGDIRALHGTQDPFNTANAETAAALIERISEAQREVNIGLLKGEISGEAWATMRDRLEEYRKALDLYETKLRTLMELEAQRKELIEAGAGGGPGGGGEEGAIDPIRALLEGRETPGGANMAVDDALKGAGDFSGEFADPAERFNDMIDAMAETRAEAEILTDAFNNLGAFGEQAMTSLIDASIAAVRGSKKSYGEMGKVLAKWTADTLKAVASQAAGKALFYTAEGLAHLSMGNGVKAGEAFAAAKTYAVTAGVAGTMAVAVGAVSANNAPTGAFMSEREKEETAGLDTSSAASGSRAITSSQVAQAAAAIHVTHVYYGNVYFGDQNQATTEAIQDQIDTGALSFGEEVS